MNVGMVGLGKLGLPVATAMKYRAHSVRGYDIDPEVMRPGPVDYIEAGPHNDAETFNDLLERFPIERCSLRETVNESDLVFVAVQTPHEAKYGGETPIPPTRADFSYEHLKAAVEQIVDVAERRTTIVIISTVLPGTINREIMPIVSTKHDVIYNPSFIAMGTTMQDFLNPEFVLIGSAVKPLPIAEVVQSFYKSITMAPQHVVSIESAELAKVGYNTFIGLKIVFANQMMEICDRIGGCDIDEVTNAIKLANKRLISPAYLQGGMGDGGGCHPRDNIALSWLADRLGLSYDLFGAMMECREAQANYLCDLVATECASSGLEPFILGRAFKADVQLENGSPALLCWHLLGQPETYDPLIDPPRDQASFRPAVYLVATNHSVFKTWEFPRGSVVIDPWRIVGGQDMEDGVRVVKVGARWRSAD